MEHFVLVVGCRWAEVPERELFAHRTVAHRWMMKWKANYVYQHVLTGLLEQASSLGKVDWTRLLIDGTFSPTPLGGEQVAHGYKGKSVLSHLLSDAQGRPLAWMSTGANGDERLQVQPLLQKVKAYLPKDERDEPIISQADRDYDARSLHRSLLGQLIYPLIPYRRMKSRPSCKLEMTSFRWRIERTFFWLKGRFEKSIEAW